MRLLSLPRHVARRVRATWRRTADAATLCRLRLLARRRGERRGRVRCGGMELAYTDAQSLYIEYKDIFVNRIYAFDCGERSGLRIVDGGGCIGMSALYFARTYPGARITCFEPDAALRVVLEENLRVNGADGVEVVAAGLAGRRGTLRFRSDGSDGGRIGDDGDASIDVTVLSDYLHEPVDFLKLNIEGQELPVLLEAEASGRLRQVREMVVEYHGFAGQAQSLGALLALLDRNGYRYLVHDFDAQTGAATKPPFRYRPGADWYCLVHARRVDVAESALPKRAAA